MKSSSATWVELFPAKMSARISISRFVSLTRNSWSDAFATSSLLSLVLGGDHRAAAHKTIIPLLPGFEQVFNPIFRKRLWLVPQSCSLELESLFDGTTLRSCSLLDPILV